MKVMSINLSIILCIFGFNFLLDAYPPKDFLVGTVFYRQLCESAVTKEGFSAKTKVKVGDCLYEPMENLSTEDVIFSPESGAYQKIILKQFFHLPYFFEIKTKNHNIQSAPAQLFYDHNLCEWIKAQNLTTENSVGGERVLSVERIEDFCFIQKITVEDQVFIIEHDDLLVHNSALVIAAADLTLWLDNLLLIYPIMVDIGRTISTWKSWQRLHALWNLKIEDEDTVIYQHYIKKLVTKARSYYTQRRCELIGVLKQYQQMQQIVEVLVNQSSPGLALFSLIHNHQEDMRLLPSFDSEVKLGWSDKQKLLELRDQELAKIEFEIVDIQLSLGIYFNEIEQYKASLLSHLGALSDDLRSLLKEYDAKVQQARYSQNAFQSIRSSLINRYQTIVFIECFFNELFELSQRWSVVLKLYFEDPQMEVFRKHSNLLQSYQYLYEEILNMPQEIQGQRGFIESQYRVCETLCRQFNVSLSRQTLQSFIESAQVQLREKRKQNKQNIEIKKSSIKFAAPPNDPDPEDDEKKEKLTYKNYPLDDRKGHFPDKYSGSKERPHGLRKSHDLLDTPENREKILELVRNKNKRIDLDIHDNMWYAEIQDDGSQLWAEVRVENSQIQNCGVNSVPRKVILGHGLNNYKPW